MWLELTIKSLCVWIFHNTCHIFQVWHLQWWKVEAWLEFQIGFLCEKKQAGCPYSTLTFNCKCWLKQRVYYKGKVTKITVKQMSKSMYFWTLSPYIDRKKHRLTRLHLNISKPFPYFPPFCLFVDTAWPQSSHKLNSICFQSARGTVK